MPVDETSYMHIARIRQLVSDLARPLSVIVLRNLCAEIEKRCSLNCVCVSAGQCWYRNEYAVHIGRQCRPSHVGLGDIQTLRQSACQCDVIGNRVAEFQFFAVLMSWPLTFFFQTRSFDSLREVLLRVFVKNMDCCFIIDIS